jgi:hypothetical protein
VREGATGAAAATASLEEFAQHCFIGASLCRIADWCKLKLATWKLKKIAF